MIRLWRTTSLLATVSLLAACSSPKPVKLYDHLDHLQAPITYTYKRPIPLLPAAQENQINAQGRINVVPAKEQTPITILTIDGGGMAGILPIRVIQYMQKRLQKPIFSLFDIMAVTSTGSIIGGYLTTPSPITGQVQTPDELMYLYLTESKKIFHRSFGYKVATFWGLFGPYFPSGPKEKVLADQFNGTRLSTANTNLLVSYYSLLHRRVQFFNSDLAKASLNEDYHMEDVVGAATSTPSLFAPHNFCNLDKTYCDRALDGGIAVDNPTMAAYLYARKKYPDRDLVIVSLGCGVTDGAIPENAIRGDISGWGLSKAGHFLEAMINAQVLETDLELRRIAHLPGSHIRTYYRLTTNFTEPVSVFSADRANVEKVLAASDKLLLTQNHRLQSMVETLNKIRSAPKTTPSADLGPENPLVGLSDPFDVFLGAAPPPPASPKYQGPLKPPESLNDALQW